jgi:hypothetical protein
MLRAPCKPAAQSAPHVEQKFLMIASRTTLASANDLAGQRVAYRTNAAQLLFSTLQDGVFGSLYRTSLDDLPSWLRLEYRRLFRERIDALPRLCGRLLDDYQFREAGNKKRSRFLEFFVAYFGERLDHAFDVLSRHVVRMLLSNFLNEF